MKSYNVKVVAELDEFSHFFSCHISAYFNSDLRTVYARKIDVNLQNSKLTEIVLQFHNYSTLDLSEQFRL